MKNRILALLIVTVCVLTLSACGCKHEWVEASCLTPKTCSLCEQTEGEALGHNWTAATCDTPETCTRCSEIQGDALGHQWMDATCTTAQTCTVCQKTEGEALGHTIDNWQINDEENQMTAQCTVCYTSDVREIDRQVIAETRVVGTWDSDVVSYNGSEYPVPGLHYIFREDHTFDNWYDESPDDIFAGTWEYAFYELHEASSPNVAPFEYYYILLTNQNGSYYILLNCREDYYLYNVVESVDEDGTQWLFYDKLEDTLE